MDQLPDEDAYFELSFSPNVRLISTVRRFVGQFYVQILSDPDITSRLTVATHELLENAVRYSRDGKTSIRIGVSKKRGSARTISIETHNRAATADIANVRRALEEISGAPDPEAHYQLLMRRTAKLTEGSGLGLGRVRAESGMGISFAVEADVVIVRAEATFEVNQP